MAHGAHVHVEEGVLENGANGAINELLKLRIHTIISTILNLAERVYLKPPILDNPRSFPPILTPSLLTLRDRTLQQTLALPSHQPSPPRFQSRSPASELRRGAFTPLAPWAVLFTRGPRSPDGRPACWGNIYQAEHPRVTAQGTSGCREYWAGTTACGYGGSRWTPCDNYIARCALGEQISWLYFRRLRSLVCIWRERVNSIYEI